MITQVTVLTGIWSGWSPPLDSPVVDALVIAAATR